MFYTQILNRILNSLIKQNVDMGDCSKGKNYGYRIYGYRIWLVYGLGMVKLGLSDLIWRQRS